ncbi:hypothetical protein IWZ03DRAFT_134952 [Phyllosticta citriasiana]|uniref:Fanconi-associated nuclease n=1 Tax=Phyllosticta citriasiana TaxID=595635 RepID=A0ABR1KTF3_9PEZI
MVLRPQNPSKHNAMPKQASKETQTKLTGLLVRQRPKNSSDDGERRPVKRVKVSDEKSDDSPTKSPVSAPDPVNPESHPQLPARRPPSARVIPDSDDEPDSDAFEEDTAPRQTDLETALSGITTDEEALEEYERAKHAEAAAAAGEEELRLSLEGRGQYTRSSIYVDAFDLALDTVLEEESHLFDDKENEVFRVWRGLDYEAKYLYVRLFLRKTSAWFRINKLGYQRDISDMESAIKTLQQERPLPTTATAETSHPGELEPPEGTTLGNAFTFADRSEEHITTLEEASSLLKLDELKALAKDAKVQGKNKTELLKSFRRTSGKQTGLAWGRMKRTETEASEVDGETTTRESTPLDENSNRDAHWLKKIIDETGPCVRLSLPALKLFERVHLVFYRSTEWTEKSLKIIILARIARRNFPQYIVSRSSNIFPSRAMLLEFEAALRTQFRIDNILEFNGTPKRKDLEVVLEVFEEVYPRWLALLNDEQRKEDSIYLSGEGAYLRRLSPAWVYTRIAHKAAAVFGRFKNHKREHELLSELLAQRLFHIARRGPWYQRKALLEEHYMAALTPTQGRSPEAQKQHWREVALATCEEGLQDHLTHLVYHYDLQKRVMKLEKRLKVAKRLQHSFTHVRLAAPVEVYIEGTRIERPADPFAASSGTTTATATTTATPRIASSIGSKTIWLDTTTAPSPSNPLPTCSVEQMCLAHYQRQGWRGAHTEGSILTTLFALLFHDVLFAYVPHVFQTPYQSAPLDLSSDAFFAARSSLVRHRLAEIENGGAEDIARGVWDSESERRTAVVGLDWAKWTWGNVREVLRAFGGEGLSAVCKVLCQEYGARRAGVPDLFLWRVDDDAAPSAIGGKADADADAEPDVKQSEEQTEGQQQNEPKRRITGTGAPECAAGTNSTNSNNSSNKNKNSTGNGSRTNNGNSSGGVLFVEVKSANDRLSDAQRLWIHVLTGAGVRVELANAVAGEVRVVPDA